MAPTLSFFKSGSSSLYCNMQPFYSSSVRLKSQAIFAGSGPMIEKRTRRAASCGGGMHYVCNVSIVVKGHGIAGKENLAGRTHAKRASNLLL